MPKLSPLYQRIYKIASQVPYGKVISYGQIARMAGCGPRVVGYAMAALKSGSYPEIPWQRVINSQGKVSVHGDGVGNAMQFELLQGEGVQFDSEGRLAGSEFWWMGKP
jgi:methylated-DNA-protein-cysteine methyltransferase-like protein